MIWHCPKCARVRETEDDISETYCVPCGVWFYPAMPAVARRVTEACEWFDNGQSVRRIERVYDRNLSAVFKHPDAADYADSIIVEERFGLEQRTLKDEAN